MITYRTITASKANAAQEVGDAMTICSNITDSIFSIVDSQILTAVEKHIALRCLAHHSSSDNNREKAFAALAEFEQRN
jgi:hypothetical protein